MPSALVTLSSIATIESGYSVKGAITDEADGTHQVVMAKHLTAGEPYRYQEEHRLRIAPEKSVEKYQVGPGDILLMSRGSWNYTVLLEDLPQPAIAPATFYIIRPNSSVDSHYLVWVMQQEAFQGQLSEIRMGSTTMMVSRSDFEQLAVPIPPLHTQKKIAALATLMCRERQIRKEISGETERLQSAIGRQILNSLIGGRGNES